ncbi:unnamed protein product, partial [Chrysoparadoxa australica]
MEAVLEDYFKHGDGQKRAPLSGSAYSRLRQKTAEMLWGKREDNAKNLKNLVASLAALGHQTKLHTSSAKQMTAKLVKMAKADHDREERKKGKKDKVAFDEKRWKKLHSTDVTKMLGPDSTKNSKYVTGIFFAPSTSLESNKWLLPLAAADGTHCQGGMYTLLSLYGLNSNQENRVYAHALVYGTECKEYWLWFYGEVKRLAPVPAYLLCLHAWHLALPLHLTCLCHRVFPYFDQAFMTCIMDGDKGG